MVMNKKGDTQCAACETIRPGFDGNKQGKETITAAASSIRTGGFMFAGTTTTDKSKIGSQGFTFAGTTSSTSKTAAESTSSNTGFSFGGRQVKPITKDDGTNISSEGTASASNTTLGLTFGELAMTPSKKETAETGLATTTESVPFGGNKASESKSNDGLFTSSPFANFKFGQGASFATTGSTKPVYFSFGSATNKNDSNTKTPFHSLFGASSQASISTEIALTPTSEENKSSGKIAQKSDAENTTALVPAVIPPISFKIPTPFGAAKPATPASGSVKSVSSGYPPLASKSPTPFGSVPASEGSTSHSLDASKSPTPFGASKPLTFGFTKTPASASKGNSLYPPVASKSPTPFGATKPTTPLPTPAKSEALTSVGSSAGKVHAPVSKIPPPAVKTPQRIAKPAQTQAATSYKDVFTNINFASALPTDTKPKSTGFSFGFQKSSDATTSGVFSLSPAKTTSAPFGALTEPMEPKKKSADTSLSSVLDPTKATDSGAKLPISFTTTLTKSSIAGEKGTTERSRRFGFKATEATTKASSSTGTVPASPTKKVIANTDASGYPPISLKAPTPFGAAPTSNNTTAVSKTPTEQATTKKDVTEYPPIAAKTPTPFGTAAPSTTKEFNIVNRETPISSAASTPFGAKVNKELTKTMSPDDKLRGEDANVSSDEAEKVPASYKDIFSKIEFAQPLPSNIKKAGGFNFGNSQTTTKIANSGFSFSSTGSSNAFNFGSSFKGLTPFGGAASSTLNDLSGKDPEPDSKKGDTLGNYPPRSSKIPTLFGNKKTMSENNSSQAPAPPLSSTVKSPFGGTAKKIDEDSSKVSVSVSAKPVALSYPPLSSKAPTPFRNTGATPFKKPSRFGNKTTKTDKDSVKSAAVDNKKGDAASFPPMSFKAPTPFGSMGAKSEKSDAAGFPPMSFKAPTPFGSMGTKSDKDSGKAAAVDNNKVDAASFPPTPFGRKSDKDSGKASTLFGPAKSQTPAFSSSLFGPNKASSNLLMGEPVVSANITTRRGSKEGSKFESFTSPESSSISVRTFGKNKNSLVASSTTSFGNSSKTEKLLPKPYYATSEYEVKLWSLIRNFSDSLSSLKDKFKEFDQSFPNNKDIELLTTLCDKIRSMSTDCDAKVVSKKERLVFLLSQKNDIDRQIQEAQRLVGDLLPKEDDRESYADLVKKQPLDKDSEAQKRKLSSHISSVQKTLDILSEKVELLEKLMKNKKHERGYSCMEKRVRNRSVYLIEESDREEKRALFGALKRGYDRTQQVEVNLSRLESEVAKLKKKHNARKGESTALTLFSTEQDVMKAVTCADKAVILPKPKKGSRITPLNLPFSLSSSQAKIVRKSNNNQALSLQLSTKELAMKKISRGVPLEVKIFACGMSLRKDTSRPTEAKVVDRNWRHTTKSQLMDSSCASSSGKESNIAKPLFTSPVVNRDGRTAFVNKEPKVNDDLFTLPSTKPRQINAKQVARDALSLFGVTPEKVKENRETIRRGEENEKQRRKEKEKEEAAKKQATTMIASQNRGISSGTKSFSFGAASAATAFPPMPSQAPTPFSKISSQGKAVDTAENVAEKPLKTTENKDIAKSSGVSFGASAAAFPPMSTKAPTPFSKTNDGKSQADRSAEKISKKSEEDGSKTPLGSFSFNSFGKDIDKKKETPKQSDTASTFSNPFSKNDTAAAATIATNEHAQKSAMSTSFGALKVPTPPPSSVFGGQTNDKGNDGKVMGLGEPDYKSLLLQFYQQHNPSKVGEVEKNLAKYKGKETEMFSKLAKKYKVPNPLDKSSTLAASPSSGSIPLTQPSPFSAVPTPAATKPSPFGTTQPSSSSPFNSAAGTSSAPTPFGTMPSSSPFGAPTAPVPTSPFGGGGSMASSTAISTFGAAATNQAAPSPFGAATQSAAPSGFRSASTTATPFGTTAFGGQPQQQQPFGGDTANTNNFGGRPPREILISFYQTHNPTKISEVDKLLAKYAGKEEQLFRNLAKKYNLDPKMFGIQGEAPAPAAPAPFGSASQSGSGFGQASSGFGGGVPTSTPFGGGSSVGMGSAFGQTSGLGGGGGVGTGSGSTFGGSFGTGNHGTAVQPFGSSTSGFGAAAATGGAFGGGSGGGFGSLATANPAGFGASAPKSSSGGFGSGGGFGSPTPTGFGSAGTPAPAPGGFGGGGFGSFGGGGGSSSATPFGSPGGFGQQSPFGAARR